MTFPFVDVALSLPPIWLTKTMRTKELVLRLHRLFARILETETCNVDDSALPPS